MEIALDIRYLIAIVEDPHDFPPFDAYDPDDDEPVANFTVIKGGNETGFELKDMKAKEADNLSEDKVANDEDVLENPSAKGSEEK